MYFDCLADRPLIAQGSEHEFGRGVFIFAGFRPGYLLAGVFLGAINYVAVYALLKVLALEGWESSQLYPIYGVGVAVSALLVISFFKEKLSRKKAVGLLVGIAAVALLNH